MNKIVLNLPEDWSDEKKEMFKKKFEQKLCEKLDPIARIAKEADKSPRRMFKESMKKFNDLCEKEKI